MPAVIPCPSQRELALLLVGQVPASEAAALEEHLETCQDCAATARSLASSDTFVQAMQKAGEVAVESDNVEVDRLIDRLLALAPHGASKSPSDTLDFLRPAEKPDEIGRLGPYRVLKLLGSGGMGMVFLAEDPRLSRLVALKVLKPGWSISRTAKERFERESRAIASLTHDHIVPVHEVGEDRGCSYFAMPFLEGETLAERLRREPRLPPVEAVRIARQIADGLVAAHQRGLIHRDIKPGNIWLEGPTARVRILDFGLASDAEDADKLTHSGDIIGTPAYMAPEQVSSKSGPIAISTVTDVYGVGAILYEELTGRPPFTGETIFDTLQRVREASPRPVRQFNPHVDRDLETIVHKCLEKDPKRRYQSAEALGQDLDRWIAGEPIEARPVRRAERVWRWCRRNRMVTVAAVAAALGVVVLAVASIIAWQQRQEAVRQRNAVEEQRARAELHYREARDAVDQMLTEVGQNKLVDVPQMSQVRRELLERALAFYERFVQEGENDPGAQQDQGKAYLRLGEIYNHLGDFAKSDAAYAAAERIFADLVSAAPAEGSYRADLIASIMGTGWDNLSKPKNAERRYLRALPHGEELARQFPDNAAYLDAFANIAKSLGTVHPPKEASNDLQRAREIEQRAVGLCPTVQAYRHHLSHILGMLGRVHSDLAEYAQAEAFEDEAIAITKKLVEEFPHSAEERNLLAEQHLFMGQLLAGTGRADRAEEPYRSALAAFAKLSAEFPGVPVYDLWKSNITFDLGRLQAQAGRWIEAEKSFRDAAAMFRRQAAAYPTGLWNQMSRVNLAWLLVDMGDFLRSQSRFQDAKDALMQAITVGEQGVKDYPDEHHFSNNLNCASAALAEVLGLEGKLQESERRLRECLARQEKVVAEENKNEDYRTALASIQMSLTHVLVQEGKQAEASGMFQQAKTTFERLISENPGNIEFRQRFAVFLTKYENPAVRDPDRALTLANEAVRLSPQDRSCWRVLGQVLFEKNDCNKSIDALTKSMELGKGGDSNDWFYLAMAHARLGHEEESQKWHKQAEAWMQKNMPNSAELRELRKRTAGVVLKASGK